MIMKELKRISKQASEFLSTTVFTVEEVKAGTVKLCRTRNGYECLPEMQEVPTFKGKKTSRCYSEKATPAFLIKEAIIYIREGNSLAATNVLKLALEKMEE